MLTVLKKDPQSSARVGVIDLPHGPVESPAFMPVGTNGTIKALDLEKVVQMEYKLILGNTYHLYLRPGIEVIEQLGGLHRFIGWKGNILTDSGGFQLFSLSPFCKIVPDLGVQFRSHIDGSLHLLSPERVVEIQAIFGSDIQMALDVCTPYGCSEKEAKEAVEVTSDWASRAAKRWREGYRNYEGQLFGIVQGNFFEKLRYQSAQEILELDTPGVALGGLSVGEPQEVFYSFLSYTASLIPKDKPRYLMGIGTPDYILAAVEAGIDLFDCVYPTRIARNGTCLTSKGKVVLKNARYRLDENPIDPVCDCFVCRRFSRAYLRHLFKTQEILGLMLATEHNLFFLASFLRSIRQKIREGRFIEFKKNFLREYFSDAPL